MAFSCDGIYIYILLVDPGTVTTCIKALTWATPPFSYNRTVTGHFRVQVALPNHLKKLKQEAFKGMLEYCIALYND